VSVPSNRYRRRVLDDELDLLFASLPAIAIEGAKAVGKTATATLRARTTWALDDPAQREIVEADLNNLFLRADFPVLVDEWQRVPPIWDRVRRDVDADATPGRFLLTGSASPKGTGTHSGSGRIVSLRMRPLSLAERFDAGDRVSLTALLSDDRVEIAGKTGMLLADYADEILRSGFPGLRGLSGRPLRIQLDSYLQRVVDRDFPELGQQIRNPSVLRRWMTAYAAASATTATFETIRDASISGDGVVPQRSVVTPYRDVLSRLYLIDPVPGWRPTRNHIRELTEPPKHHLADPALAARLVGATRESLLKGEQPGLQIPRDGIFLGALFESLVTLSIRVYAQPAEARVSHLRTQSGRHEVDLIVERGDGKVVAFEVKLNPSVSGNDVKHLLWLKSEIGDDMLDMVVVTTGPQAYRRSDGVAVVPAALLGP
jgi:predicted AAA+ superfamily ATPase